MLVLWLITLLWALSFSLIGIYLAADVDAYIAVLIRMLLATLLLTPFLKLRDLQPSYAIRLMLIGSVQVGMMYIFLYHAFNYLSVAEVLLFTIFTPLYITLLDEVVINRKPIPSSWWLAAGLSVAGAAVIRFTQPTGDFWTGFWLIQIANLCFAAGQVAYKRLTVGDKRQQVSHYALFFCGALIVSALASAAFADWQRVPTTATHWAVLIWLGVVASGVGYLAWSIASKQVNIAQLASMNNMLIPAGLLINFTFWGQDVNWPQLLLGAGVITVSVGLASMSPAQLGKVKIKAFDIFKR